MKNEIQATGASCAKCGKKLLPNAKFCHGCGYLAKSRKQKPLASVRPLTNREIDRENEKHRINFTHQTLASDKVSTAGSVSTLSISPEPLERGSLHGQLTKRGSNCKGAGLAFGTVVLLLVSVGFVLSTIDIVSRPTALESPHNPYDLSLKISPATSGDAELAREIAAKIDSGNSVTRNFAARLAAKYPGSYNIGQVCSIYDYVYSKWTYVSDPGRREYFAKASESIQNDLRGDCDDFAILMAAAVEAIGGKTRIIVANGHAWAEVSIGYGASARETVIWIQREYNSFWSGAPAIHYHEDSIGDRWLNLDWSASHPGGPFHNASQGLVIYPNGEWERVRFTG